MANSFIHRLLIGVVVFALSFVGQSAVAQNQEGNNQGIVANQGGTPTSADASSTERSEPEGDATDLTSMMNVNQLFTPNGLTSTLKVMLLMTVLSLAPSILIMTTCFIRFVVVLGLLRQALGTQQLPPNQVIISLCLFLTFMVMAPVWEESYENGVKPYTSPPAGVSPPSLDDALTNTVAPLRRFMSEQIDKANNGDTVMMFLDFQKPASEPDSESTEMTPETYAEVPLSVLLPSYMMSELKTAFVIGFQIYLPFLVIDMVVASVLLSMGMMMLPPVLISLPFKLLLFVMIDGWFLTVGMLLQSVRPFG